MSRIAFLLLLCALSPALSPALSSALSSVAAAGGPVDMYPDTVLRNDAARYERRIGELFRYGL